MWIRGGCQKNGCINQCQDQKRDRNFVATFCVPVFWLFVSAFFNLFLNYFVLMLNFNN